MPAWSRCGRDLLVFQRPQHVSHKLPLFGGGQAFYFVE